MSKENNNDGSFNMATEDVARAVHAAWMDAKLADGWTYGSKRNDELKQHPCLVPYDELPEREKAYDYITANAVITKLKAMGYEIKKINAKRNNLK